MKKTINSIFLTITFLVTLGVFTLNAAVSPTTANVVLFCSDTNLDLGVAPTGTEWRILYSVEETLTPASGPTLTGSVVSAADLETGYYYVYTVGDALNPEICESEMTELPLYKFKSLTVALDALDYCVEDAGDQTFSSTITSADVFNTFSYQWYTVEGGTETKIDGATSATYKPDVLLAVDDNTTYRVKGGYLVDSKRYCSAFDEKGITILPRPGKPTISVIIGSAGEDI